MLPQVSAYFDAGTKATWQQSYGMSTWTVISTVANVALLLALGILINLSSPNNTPGLRSLLQPLDSNFNFNSTNSDTDIPACLCSCPTSPSSVAQTRDSTPAEVPGTAGTSSVETGTGTGQQCVTPAFPLTGPESDWYTLKIYPPPAPCTVQGFVIDHLEPEYNFRRPYALGSTSLEDKTFLLMYLRAVQDRRMATRKRRVLLDLGANSFESSTLWFLKNYPLAFTQVHTFEVVAQMFRKPEPVPEPDDLLEHLTYSSQVPGAANLTVQQRSLDSITLHEKYVGVQDGANAVNITRFILEELGLTSEDAVVVKMDIESAEWAVLNEWMSVPEMPSIVDELFVEVHYNDPSMTRFGWNMFPNSRTEAAELFQKLRGKGFFVHPWP